MQWRTRNGALLKRDSMRPTTPTAETSSGIVVDCPHAVFDTKDMIHGRCLHCGVAGTMGADGKVTWHFGALVDADGVACELELDPLVAQLSGIAVDLNRIANALESLPNVLSSIGVSNKPLY